MKLVHFVIGIVVVLALALLAVIGYLVFTVTEEQILVEKTPAVFSVLETGTASHYGYAVFNYRGEGNVTMIGLDSKPSKKITIINDTEAIQANKYVTLIDQVKELEEFGYTITVTDKSSIGNDVYIVPTGAIPASVLFSLQQNTSNGTIIYIGEKDLILSSGIKQQPWYDSLTPEQRKRIVQYDGTLDDFIEEGNVSLVDELLYMTWGEQDSSFRQLKEHGLKTTTIDMTNAEYFRLIYQIDDIQGVYDSSALSLADTFVDPEPQEVSPGERSTLLFSLNKTNGTAFLSIKHNGKEVKRSLLRRVTDENVFLEKLEYDEPGDYVIEVEDNSGTIATGLLHVKDLNIELFQRTGMTYVFSVTVDGQPVEDTDAYISLGNSEDKKKFYVSDGFLTVTAKLNQGLNVFNVEIFDTNVPVLYDNVQDNVLDFYIKYGLPGLIAVFAIYFAARISKTPTYSLRFGDSVTIVREEIKVPAERALESFRKIRSDMHLEKSPITPHEFAISLKRYLTNGAEITEGNVEEMLKNLVKTGRLESYRDYYQMHGEGHVKRNALRRIVRDKLIESGTMFQEKTDKFVTKDFEIGFFGTNFSKKGIIIVEDKAEARRIMSKLSGRERSSLTLKESNGMIEFVPIDKLEDVL